MSYNPNMSSKYYTAQYWYPRLELDDKLIDLGHQCFTSWNKKLKLEVYFRLTYSLPKDIYGTYTSLWRLYNSRKDRFGEILIDVEKHNTEEELYDTIRHELAHAICDLRYGMNCGHGSLWIHVAKLLRVRHSQYCKHVN